MKQPYSVVRQCYSRAQNITVWVTDHREKVERGEAWSCWALPPEFFLKYVVRIYRFLCFFTANKRL